MSMTILNNTASMMTLGELNKNISKVGRQLKRVSTGQKLNGADDNASDYGISEQMRAKIRALEQDVQNVQNGSSMLKVALGGIQSIVDELRDLKELAIDAANDSNSDADRATMQKVLKQKQANIDNIAANTSFNSKALLDGTYRNPHWKEKFEIQYGPLGIDQNLVINPDMKIRTMTLRKVAKDEIRNDSSNLITDDLANVNVKINVTQTVNAVTGLASAFKAMNNSVTFADGTNSVETKDTALYSQRPENITDPSTGYIVPNRNFIRATGGAPMAVKIDFSGARDANGNAIFNSNGYADGNSISQLNDQGFSILFSDSSHFVNIKFNTGSEETTWNNTVNGWPGDNFESDIEYTVGIQDLNRAEGITQKEFTNTILDKIYNASERISYVDQFKYDLSGGAGCDYIKDNVNNFSLSQKYNLRMARDNNGDCYLTMNQNYKVSMGILDEGMLGRKFIGQAEVQSAAYTPMVNPVYERYSYKEDLGNPLWIQHGTESGQHMNIFFNSMYNSALGTDAADVTTRDRAVASIDYIDVALEYALDEATNVGAYLKRMEYTEANVLTEDENTQAAESTIRDADMSKEITEYTKFNVLTQASQSMLAQANQNFSGVLSLLQ